MFKLENVTCLESCDDLKAVYIVISYFRNTKHKKVCIVIMNAKNKNPTKKKAKNLIISIL
jgi:hypothetical protein